MRDGLKLQEVHKIAREFSAHIADDEDEATAYKLACRAVPGCTPETYARWKPDIIKLAKGERTALDPLPPTPKGTPGQTAAGTIEKLRDENEKLKQETALAAKEGAEQIEQLRDAHDEKDKEIQALKAELEELTKPKKK